MQAQEGVRKRKEVSVPALQSQMPPERQLEKAHSAAFFRQTGLQQLKYSINNVSIVLFYRLIGIKVPN